MPFRFTLTELSGALADLGVMLPLVVALITLNGVDASSSVLVIALAYVATGLLYRLPLPVQPLKSLAATALALHLAPTVVTAGAWWMAAIFLVLAATGAATWVNRVFPIPVIRGIQIGLGLLLARSAWLLVTTSGPGRSVYYAVGPLVLSEVWLVAAGAAAILVFGLWWRPGWAALLVVGYGIALAAARTGLPEARLAMVAPRLAPVHAADLAPAFWLLALPQVPLSLANSVFATADAARQYFGSAAAHVTPGRLLMTMGAANVAAALLGGVPVCHGSGGLTAHVRLGARSGGAPVMLGLGFLALALLGGASLLPVLRLIPYPALGVLLAYVGVQHLLLARGTRGAAAWTTALTVAVVAFATLNLAWGFAAGVAVHFALPRLVPASTPVGRPAAGERKDNS